MTVDLTFNLSDLVGNDFDARRTKVWIETNIDGDAIVDATGNTIRLGDAKATVNVDGTGSFTGLTATNAATNPTNFQYRVFVDYPKATGQQRAKWDSGWFSLTATTDLADVVAAQYVPPTFMTDATNTLQGYVDQGKAYRDQQSAIAGLTGEDAAVANLIGTSGSLTETALSDSIEENAGPGARSVTGPGGKALSKYVTPTTPQRLRVVALGDSVAYFKWRFMYDPLNRAYGAGQPGASISVGQTGTGWGLPGVSKLATTGTVTDATTDFDVWFSGYTDRFETGATRTYGIGGVNAYWDTAKVYYAKGTTSPDGGTFKVQVDGVDEGAVVDTNAAAGMGIVTITKGSVAQRGLKIVNLTGAHRIIGVAFINSAVGGCIFSGIAQGGISLQDATANPVARANLTAYLNDFQPDIITLECKENSSYYATALGLLLDAVEASTTTATFVGIGSTPLATSDADQVIQNAQLRDATRNRNHLYFDGYGPFGSYARLNALGWAGDGTHVDDKASAFLAGLMLNELSLLSHPGETKAASDYYATRMRVRDALHFGDPDQIGSAYPIGAITRDGQFDLKWLISRTLAFTEEDGVVDASGWLVQPDNASDQQIPSGIRVGSTGPYLQASSATLLGVFSARGGGVLRDLQARTLMAGTFTMNGQSGALAIDLSQGSVFYINLTGNVTSVAFSNSSGGGNEIELHFIQDATGGRTVGGWNSSIHLRTGFALGTAAGKRSVVSFRQQGGSYFQKTNEVNDLA